MSREQVVLNVGDLAIVSALKRGPLSARELSRMILRHVKEAWADKHAYEIAWDTDEEPVGASGLACAEAREMGFKLMRWEIDARLRSLEKRGCVARIQVEGHRPMLWCLVDDRGAA